MAFLCISPYTIREVETILLCVDVQCIHISMVGYICSVLDVEGDIVLIIIVIIEHNNTNFYFNRYSFTYCYALGD